MYHVSAQGVDGRMINVHYYYNNTSPNKQAQSKHKYNMGNFTNKPDMLHSLTKQNRKT